MKNIAIGCLFALISVFFISCSHPSKKYLRLCVGEVQLQADEKIIAFDLSIEGATFDSLPKIPLAWTLSLSNNSSGLTTLKAGAISYSAGLDPSGLGYLATFVKTEFSDNPKAELILYVVKGDEKEKKIVVDPKALRFEPSP